MRGTGSNTVVVDHVAVPERRAISPFAPSRIDRPLYRIPAFTIASTGSAPIVVGIAQAAIDEVIALAPTKRTDNGQVLAERPHAHSRIGAAQTSLDAARALLRSAAGAIDEAAEAGDPVTELLRARMRAAMSHAAAVTRDVLLTCQQLASSTAIYSDTTDRTAGARRQRRHAAHDPGHHPPRHPRPPAARPRRRHPCRLKPGVRRA